METAEKTKLRDTYQEVTDSVIAQLEKGIVPWQKTWKQGSDSGFFPTNYLSKKAYRGFNVFWLNMFTDINGFKTNRYMTFKQALQAGGKIKKGSKGTQITYWAQIERKPGEDEDGEVIPGKKFMVPKIYTVFNVDQTEGIAINEITPINRTIVEKLEICEYLVYHMKDRPMIHIRGDEPCYNISKDIIEMPEINIFNGSEYYYQTLFHELAHSTGHEKRLNRKGVASRDHSVIEYANEELVAELTAAFLSAYANIGDVVIENSAAYIGSWLERLKNDKKLILTAAARAQRATDYILGINPMDETIVTENIISTPLQLPSPLPVEIEILEPSFVPVRVENILSEDRRVLEMLIQILKEHNIVFERITPIG